LEDDSRRLLLLARHYLDIGQPNKSIESLNRVYGALLLDPDYWFIRGQALFDLNRPMEAVDVAQRGLAENPDYCPLLYLLCCCYEKIGKPSDAERAILAALRLVPEEPRFLCRYALLVGKAGQLDKAERLINEAARIDANHPIVPHTRTMLAFLRGNNKHAGQHSRQILASYPEDPTAHYNLGVAQHNAGNMVGGARHMRNAARLDPQDPQIVKGARHSRASGHWLLLPLTPIHLLGPAKLWVFAILILITLNFIGLHSLARYFAITYFLLCVYSWVVPPILRWWMRRRNG
jgi:Flp pilus assembly protein TadD